MDRVETLIQKLQQLYADKAPLPQWQAVIAMLQAELYSLYPSSTSISASSKTVSVVLPNGFVQTSSQQEQLELPIELLPEHTQENMEKEEEKVYETLQIDEKEIEAELEEIKQKAKLINKVSSEAKPALLFDLDDEELPPTLAHQPIHKNKQKITEPTKPKELNETIVVSTESLNEKLKQGEMQLADKLTELPVKDLKKAIGVNDRFLFINELFRGDEAMYERSIKTINSFSIYPEAEYWIQRELKVKLSWDDEKATTQLFYQLVKRRFL